ncbi:MAG: DUF3891 family protein [Candidatus Poribacteria bacterium]|nr:DUF3891 family protein [Candidatus Poribacteria bacterium]
MFRSKTRNLIFPQPEHGRLAGEIAQRWGNDEFARPALDFDAFVAGVALHDGWSAWDTYVDTLGIGEMDAPTRFENLTQQARARLDNPISETIMHLHTLRIIGDAASRQPMRDECEARIEACLRETGIPRDTFLWADRVTDLCESMSFDFCFEQPATGTVKVFPTHESREPVSVRYEVDGRGGITLDPWTLREPAYTGFIFAFEADRYPERLRPVFVPYRLSPP